MAIENLITLETDYCKRLETTVFVSINKFKNYSMMEDASLIPILIIPLYRMLSNL